MDSNHRNPKMTDLQSVPFNHSGTYPFLNKCVKNKYYYSGSPRTCQHLFHFYFLRIQTGMSMKLSVPTVLPMDGSGAWVFWAGACCGCACA